IGIVPAWGGTVRLTRLIGLRKALPLILTGKTLPPKKARKLGIIDETVRPEAVLAAAKRLVMSGPKPKRRLPLMDRLTVKGPVLRRVLASAEAKTLRMTHGHYPAAI